MTWSKKGDWADYYSATNYSTGAFSAKEKLVAEFIDAVQPASVWDLGANAGVFSRIAADKSISTIALDSDAAAVEANYQRCAAGGPANLLPLVCDLTNPSPRIGWAAEERQSLEDRGPADLIMSLALIHHLAIANNVPLEQVADYWGRLGRHLLIEFVPKGDSQVERMLRTREDVFDQYHIEAFERAFETVFSIERRSQVEGSQRTLYLMRRR
jgi:ribosomal protein L11 methylase PrmA